MLLKQLGKDKNFELIHSDKHYYYDAEKIKNDNILYTYNSHYNEYHPGSNEVSDVETIQDKDSKHPMTIKRFTIENTFILETIPVYLREGITIKSL